MFSERTRSLLPAKLILLYALSPTQKKDNVEAHQIFKSFSCLPALSLALLLALPRPRSQDKAYTLRVQAILHTVCRRSTPSPARTALNSMSTTCSVCVCVCVGVCMRTCMRQARVCHVCVDACMRSVTPNDQQYAHCSLDLSYLCGIYACIHTHMHMCLTNQVDSGQGTRGKELRGQS